MVNFTFCASFCRSLKVTWPFYGYLGHLNPFQVFEAFFFYKITFLPILIMEVMELNQARGEPEY